MPTTATRSSTPCASASPTSTIWSARRPPEPGSALLLVGSDTGRDGIHGASGLASRTDAVSRFAELRPAVQVGNPFMEKLLMEACYELASRHRDWIVGMQDLGAAGLTSSVVECCAKGETGAAIDIEHVPRREEGMTPYEVMLSESQERMLIIARPDHVADVKALFEHWELHCDAIGEVIGGPDVVIREHGHEVARVPWDIATEPPEYRRSGERPADVAERNAFDLASLPDIAPGDATGALLRLLARPNIASKRGVFRQYDQQVLGNTVVLPGGDAAVVRIDGTTKAIALATDCNARLVYLDPYTGAAAAVAEAARNIVCTGASPVAVTDCLNFGNPEMPGVYFSMEQAVRGLSEACSAFDTPVVSGNVSLYNERSGVPVYPTPVVGMMGVLDDVAHHLGAAFTAPGAHVWLLGAAVEQPAAALAGSEYLEAEHGQVAGLPTVDLDAERRLQQLVLQLNGEGLLYNAHDASDGGLAVALAESCMLGGLGFEPASDLDLGERLDAALFGEGQGRIIVSVPEDTYRQTGSSARLADLAAQHGVPATRLGRVTDGGGFRLGPIETTLPVLLDAYEALLRQ
ncbi:MAG: phosphoribosylformylglycinamidine synthase subunit PurL [Dehalococcoidia bacterium]|nr:phosphoribosylformylglycinamidine synthase subunit PurL [Dehalococcoidia bacterium]